MRPLTRNALLAAACTVVLATGCSSSDDDGASTDTTSTTTAPTPAATAADAPVAAQWGEVEGTDGRHYIADEHGRALQFRGVNIKTAEPLEGASEELLDELAARGFNHIRLSAYWNLAEPTDDQYDEQYLADLDTAIERANERGLYVIVDFHQDVYGEAFADNGMPEWATITNGKSFEDTGSFLTNYLQPAVQEAWEGLYEDPDIRAAQIEWYTTLAERMQAHPNVIGYDLLNEPFGKVRPGEDVATAAARVESEQITPMYQRLTDAIRTVDDDRWIFIEPPNLASLGVATSLGEIDDERIVFYPHMYDANIEGETYNGDGNPDAYDPAFFQKWADAISTYTDKYPVPMLVGEWGLATPENPELAGFITETLTTLEGLTSGWSHFAGCMGESYCTLAADGSDRPGLDQIIQPYAAAIAGAPTSTAFDVETGVLRIEFDDNDESDADTTTDIVVPAASSYPDGWLVVSADDDFEVEIDDGERTDGSSIAHVTTPDTGGTHVVCVLPPDSTATCE